VRQKVIPNKEAEKHKIIQDAFKVYLEGGIYNLQILLQVLPQHPDVKKLLTRSIVAQ
jgi:hypothetical protein